MYYLRNVSDRASTLPRLPIPYYLSVRAWINMVIVSHFSRSENSGMDVNEKMRENFTCAQRNLFLLDKSVRYTLNSNELTGIPYRIPLPGM